MIVSEAELRQLISQKVEVLLLDMYITEALHTVLREVDDAEDDEKSLRAYKDAAAAELKSYVLKGLLPVGVFTALMGYLGQETTSYSDTKAALHKAETQAAMAASQTDEAQFDELTDQLNNQYAFRWGKGNESVVHYPGSNKKITVLPPSYSVMVKVLQDKKKNAEYIEQGIRPRFTYGPLDPNDELGLDHDRQYEGSYEDNIEDFFRTFDGKDFVDAMSVLGTHDELDVVPGSGMEDLIVMVDPNKIDGDYYLPEIGMTAEDWYNYQYTNYMGSGEKEALGIPDEEMIVTPDDDDGEKLDPGLIDATNKRALQHQKKLRHRRRSMKENKITWKNYRNRKKVLA